MKNKVIAFAFILIVFIAIALIMQYIGKVGSTTPAEPYDPGFDPRIENCGPGGAPC